MFAKLDDTLAAAMKDPLAVEIIILTHDRPLHQVNLAWPPKAEALFWRPDLREKVSDGGKVNLRFRTR